MITEVGDRTRSVLDVMVSAFKNVKETKEPKPVNLLTWLTSMRYKHQVDAIRRERNVDRQKHMKKQVPLVTVSGTFAPGRTNVSLIQHSGLICIDIDEEDNPNLENWNTLEKELKNLSHAAYVGRSVRGRGFMIIIPIAYPALHTEQFKALQDQFIKCGIVIDSKCRNVSRARFYSYDDNAYFNHQAIPFYGLPKSKERSKKQHPADNKAQNRFLFCLAEIESHAIDITSDYYDWLGIARGFVNEFGEAGRQFFHRVSRFYPGYEERATDRKYSDAIKAPGNASMGTFFHLCKVHGVKYKAASDSIKPCSDKKKPEGSNTMCSNKDPCRASGPIHVSVDLSKSLPSGWSRNSKGELLDRHGLVILDWWTAEDIAAVSPEERQIILLEIELQKPNTNNYE